MAIAPVAVLTAEKKNLTRINHKVSVIATRPARANPGVFVTKCAHRRIAARAHSCSSRRIEIMLDAITDLGISPVGGGATGDFRREIGALRSLNRRFLDLESTSVGLNGRLARLSAAQKDTVAACPYALFDVRLHDAAHWQGRLCGSGGGRVADSAAGPNSVAAAAPDRAAFDFLRLALFFAWHVAAASSAGVSRLAPLLVLGMPAHTTAAFARAPVSAILELAQCEAGYLTARWRDCDNYWSALATAAEARDETRLRRVRLYGIQLAAAAQLPLRA